MTCTRTGAIVPNVRLTPMSRLTDHLLEGGLEDFVRTRRAAGRSWRRIALDIRDLTAGAIDITHQALQSWFPDTNGDAQDAAS